MTRFPAHFAHEGIWEGKYRHLAVDGTEEGRFRSRVTCEFPQKDGVIYRQTTELWTPEGAYSKAGFDGLDRGDHLFYDSPTFHGRSWETEGGHLMLNLIRKDEPGAYFVELIIMGEGGKHRARTWHWFKDGQIYRRTLCEESRVV
ncbi:hypothetical protein HPO_02924 [Hyphomonas polymorpha PS728]|uniref:DUF3598 domain-containing protein n=1 Tax=Hyphomonas polymorpha PS728 TaxID=1280954 RepID=A0A062VBJ9_9PROT|nr:hypothetical protein [Hyphomonas polymorpha]KCZ99810.1 hypothetical protein HPO_02924 [Hyphomonas polymorpha PS728]